MSKKILLLAERDQFKGFDYFQEYHSAMKSIGNNSGNCVFQYSLQKLLSNGKNKLDINTNILYNKKENYYQEIEHINSEYDCVVFVPANMIAQYAAKSFLPYLTSIFNRIDIPIYAIGLGAQSDYDYSLDLLLNLYDKEIYINFIKSILRNNGRIGLRGYFSAEVIKKLGFDYADFSIIGCPSLFMNGPNINIKIPNFENLQTLRVAINGFRAWNSPYIQQYFRRNSHSFFVDQEEFYKLLYCNNGYTWKEYQYLSNSDNYFFDMYKSNRIKLFCDFQEWIDWFRSNIDFSFGCRIHGNIVPLLAGIPSYVDCFDSRTRELSEYFYIPHSCINYDILGDEKNGDWGGVDMLYNKLDYTKFNKNFSKNFDRFVKFMESCGLHIEYNNYQEQQARKSSKPINNNLIEHLNDKLNVEKKIAFVAHEFGLFRGHGGIASYLYNIVSWLLRLPNITVTVLAKDYDVKCDLFSNSRFYFIPLHGDLNRQRAIVCKTVKDGCFNYVEFADFQALGLNCIKEKYYKHILTDTVLVVNCHTATKECYEWSNFKFVDTELIQEQINAEHMQMILADICISPSSFLSKYVKKNYNLGYDIPVYANPYFSTLNTKEEIIKRLNGFVDLEIYKDTFNIVLVSRFEGRKNQDKLVEAVDNLIDAGLNIKLFLAGNTTLDEKGCDFRYEIYKKIRNLKHIFMYDFLHLSEQEKLISIADLIVLPSIFENQPVSMIEAVLMGVPVMASRFSGVADYTHSGELLFNPFVDKDLENKIKLFYNMNQNERESIRLMQYRSLVEFIDPKKSIIDRINIKPLSKFDFKSNMENLI